MIEMENVVKSFPWEGKQVNILNGISLFIGKGEFVSIMGPSGSGKSTLSSILGCLASPSSGTYNIDEKNVAQYTSTELARLRNKKIGFIFQDFNLLEGLSAADNVALPLFYAGVSPSERFRKAYEALKIVGLETRVKHRPNQLSGGQKQRVAVARAIVNEPAFLFADEPTGALDTKTGEEIMGLMQRLNLMGHTIVQVTHSPGHALYSKRILHLVSGSIVKDELVENPIVGAIAVNREPDSELLVRLWKLAQCKAPVTDELLSVLSALYERSKNNSLALIEMAKQIVKWDHPKIKEMMEDLFQHEFWGVRAELIRSFAVLKKSESIFYYLRGLKDTNSWTRFLAVQQLARQWPLPVSVEQKEFLISMLNDEDERIRASMVNFVAKWKEKDLLPLILKLTTDSDGRVRANTFDMLLMFQKEGWELPIELSYLEDKNNRARANAAILCYPKFPGESFETLKKMILNEHNLMRASASWALGRIPNESAGPLLLEGLKGEADSMVINQMVSSLSKLGETYFPLSQQLTRLMETLQPVVKAAA